MAKMMATMDKTSASGGAAEWKAVWKINIPPKVKVFWWRVLHGSLPSKSEPKRRHVKEESFCETCGAQNESLFHIFFRCSVVKMLWGEVKKLNGVSVPDLHPCMWATDVLRSNICHPDVAAVVICGAWSLWTGRNGQRHGRRLWAPGAMDRYISKLLEQMTTLKGHVNPKIKEATMNWKPPEEGWMKINTDASYGADSGTGGAGMVIRDYSGRVLAAATRRLEWVPDVLSAEAAAAKEGIELALEIGYDQVILETDCLGLKNLLEDPDGTRSSLGGLWFDITELRKSFNRFQVSWVRRDANRVAHACAARALDHEHSFFLFEDFPDWLLLLAAADGTQVN